MAEVLWTRVVWDHQQGDMPLVRMGNIRVRFLTVHVSPEPGWPAGRKGLQIASAWDQFRKGERRADTAGMVILDGDVAVDPLHVAQMHDAIVSDPAAVHVAAVKLWPASSLAPAWCYSHWDDGGPGQNPNAVPKWFGFSFTYLPAALIERCVKDGLKGWTYPNCDACVSQRAQALRLRCVTVPGCFPVHLHW
jgi:hypothetical protein